MEAALIAIVILLALLVAGMWYLRTGDKKTAERELADARAALTAAQKEREQAVADRDEARQARVQADGDLVAARQDAQKARANVADLEQRVADARAAIEEREALSRAHGEQADRLVALEIELGDARNQLGLAGNELEVARVRVAEAEKELAAADRRVVEVEKDVHDELQSLRTQLADARDDLAVARAEADQARQDAASEPVAALSMEPGAVAATAAPMTTLIAPEVAPDAEADATGDAGLAPEPAPAPESRRAVRPENAGVPDGTTEPAADGPEGSLPAAAGGSGAPVPAGSGLRPSEAAAVGLWDLELLRLQRVADGIDHARLEFSDDPAQALVQALRIEVSAMRDLVGTGGEVVAETLPPVSPATALVALRVSQEVLGAIGRQCDQVDVVVSDEDGLTITVAGHHPEDPVDPGGVLDRLATGGAASGVELATVSEPEAFLVVTHVAEATTGAGDGPKAG